MKKMKKKKLLKPIPLPDWFRLMTVVKPKLPPRPVDRVTYQRFRIRPKWKISNTYVDSARVDREHILAYDWSAEFTDNRDPSITVEVIYINSYGHYQIYYRHRAVTVLTLIVDYNNMDTFFLGALIDRIPNIKPYKKYVGELNGVYKNEITRGK
jgi:hypothetical protein